MQRLNSGLFLLFAASAFGQDDIWTPKPGPAPQLNGPTINGARPGRPFLYRIPCTGERPMRFSASNLPASLKLDATTGIITGTTPGAASTVRITLRAQNRHGRDSRLLRLVVGEKLALTPPMGWNHWYTHYARVTSKTIANAADAMIASGMADYGYQYVSIDDCWMIKPGATDPELNGPARDSAGRQLANRRFPDMKGLADAIHAKGLKAGIYTSPGPLTCANFEGAWQHEELDARTFAEWGYDLLKYDWCGYRKIDTATTDEARQKPYKLMGEILRRQSRDIVFNLCQYGMNDVWKWGAAVGGHSWRTTGDLGLEKDTRLPGFYSIAFKNSVLSEYAAPGAWNDPDYILIGWYGNARGMRQPEKAKLTADEQYSYMSLWSLMASPLFFSGDMEKLDAFTLNVLCNREVIDINQDALGKQARVIRRTENEMVLAKPLEDGGLAVGLLNLSETAAPVEVTFQDLGIKGKQKVRDPWRYRDLGAIENKLQAQLPPHGVALFRISGTVH
jgi:alpha-galactosidase